MGKDRLKKKQIQVDFHTCLDLHIKSHGNITEKQLSKQGMKHLINLNALFILNINS